MAESLSELREQVMDRAGWRCEWGTAVPDAHCDGPLETCHFWGRNTRPDLRNDPEAAWAGCRRHHDIYDGRTVQGRKREVALLLAKVLGRKAT